MSEIPAWAQDGSTGRLTPWQPPCASQFTAADPEHPHASWDLDLGDASSWQRAVQVCHGCPVLMRCRDLLLEMNPEHWPAGVIWGGSAFGMNGETLDGKGLRMLASRRRGQQHRKAVAATAAAAS